MDKPIFDMYAVSLFKYSFFISHVKTYLDTKVDEQGNIMYRIPTVIHLRKTYREPSSRTLDRTVTVTVEPTRRQPSRKAKTAGKRKKMTRKKRQTRKRSYKK